MHGGEGALLDELVLGGMVCDAMTQLVVLCEVCGRPSTKECWTCKMPICSFCTLKRHWKVSVQGKSAYEMPTCCLSSLNRL